MAFSNPVGLKPIEQFDPHASDVAQKWSTWKRSLQTYLLALNITDENQKRAILLHCGGEQLQDIFDTLPTTGTFDEALIALTTHFEPRTNVTFQRHRFRQEEQGNDSCDLFMTRLRTAAKRCQFADADEMIKDQFIEKCRSQNLRTRLLREPPRTVDDLMKVARSYEDAQKQAGQIKTDQEATVSAIHKSKPRFNNKTGGCFKPKAKHQNDARKANTHKCSRCGQSTHVAQNCWALKLVCHHCNKLGHLQKMCLLKHKPKERYPEQRHKHAQKVRTVTSIDQNPSSDSESEEIFTVDTGSQKPKCEVKINGHPLTVLIDSGASVNIIGKDIASETLNMKILPTQKLYPYGSKKPLKLYGQFSAPVAVKNRVDTATFYVTESGSESILGMDTASQLSLIRIGPDVNTLSDKPEECEKYVECFQGLEKLKGYQMKLHIDEGVKPVAQPLRRIPYSLKKKVDKKIKELVEQDIIEKVEGPTPWVSPIHVVPTNDNDIRVVIDMRRANEAIIRERHPIPTVEEVLQDLSGNSVFTELDFRSGYHQIELSEDSRHITTFVTHKGLFRYKRLLFGVNAAPEKFQNIIEQVFNGMEGVRNISDNLIVFGRSREEHDRRLEQVLERIKQSGLTLNKDKCKFRLSDLKFFGHTVSAEGIHIDNDKVNSLINAREPDTAQEIKSFLGLVNFCAKFLPHIATFTEPLRRLTKKNTSFMWSHEQHAAFQKIKDIIVQAETLAYFNQEMPTRLIVDASPVGLGAVLTQRQRNGLYRPIAFASRSLSDTEKRYSQTEKEALAVVWGIEHFHMFLYGIQFELVTDHKPLETIYSTKSKPPARIERWVLRLQPYDFKVLYRPGPSNVADPLSRLLSRETQNSQFYDDAEVHIHMIESASIPIAYTHEQLKRETEKDLELQNVKHAILTGDWISIDKGFMNVKEEFSTYDGVILRQNRIVVPKSLRSQTIMLAHEGHQGIVKTKQLLRTKVWWPQLDKDVESFVKTCHACQLVQGSNRPEPFTSTALPAEPWQHVCVDLCGPFPSGETVLVVIDYYSRWPEVAVLHKTTTAHIIHCLNVIFSRHGYPETIKSDNGPQFISNEFDQYLREINVKHRKVTPYWPQANGEVERFNRVLLKVCKTAKAEGKDWKKEIPKFLLQYRSTNHQTTGVSPAELLVGRQLRTKLLNTGQIVNRQNVDMKARTADTHNKIKTKTFADRYHKTKPFDVVNGDKVLLKQAKQNKLSLPFEDKPYTVVQKSGNSVLVESECGVTKRRNVTHLKKYHQAESTEFERSSLNDNFDSRSKDCIIIDDFDAVHDGMGGMVEQFEMSQENLDEERVTSSASNEVGNRNSGDRIEDVRKSGRVRKKPSYLKDYIA